MISQRRSAGGPWTARAYGVPYRAPVWLPGGHLQTVYPALFLPLAPVCYRRERWNTPDGDFIDLDWQDGPELAPLAIMFHGLEGSSQRHYCASFMHAVRARGWRGAVVHFRGCSGEPNRLSRAYHAGDADEIDWVVERAKSLNPKAQFFAAGVSLGGNALLKWLGRARDRGLDMVAAAAAVSAPMDLRESGDTLGAGINRIYTRNFLRTLKPKAREKLKARPELFDRTALEQLEQCSNLREFDNIVTAPMHGFANTDDFWSRASSKPDLIHIRVPTLIVNALNDPFVPARSLPAADQVSAAVTLDFQRAGGHCGFVTGPFPGRLQWLPERLLDFFAAQD